MADTPESLSEEFSTFSTYTKTPAQALDLIERARTKCPVPHSKELGGFHIYMNYEDVRRGLMDWKTYANGPSVLRPYIEGSPVFPPLSMDPPEHTPWRKVFSDGVNIRTADRIGPAVRADAIELIEGFAEKGACDLHLDLAEQVPMKAIFHILGLPREHHERVRSMTLNVLAHVNQPEQFAKLFQEFSEYGWSEVERRKSDPKEDYLTVLADARFGDRHMTPFEVGAAVVSLLVAGHGTTTAALTNLLYEVLRRPQLKQRLIEDPALIPKAVEEGLRLHHPFFGLFRKATEDVEAHGAHIKKGDTVYMCWQAANRDPAVVDKPLDFDIDRPEFQHLGFGLGKHSCVGAPTARMEMRVVMEELLARLPDIELAEPEKVKWDFHGAETLGILHLPAKFASRPRRAS
ncbi:cytochrome P450 [Xanthobacter dioxanivorans]|uniref:Cytochrome P450 n=1 Tax=Xanthobacter dioxanivorans TaxID=2528964 RepID=A0A974SIC5_9HYPH|nr:cytochrome P450 [Xanthobacter dioxanivorans]QRG07241.1 cytochrome P450 [Xanthobacter dioxanivorans]